MYAINFLKGKNNRLFSRFIFFCSIFISTIAFSCSSSGEKEQEKNTQDFATQKLEKTSIPIEGMTCSACVARIKKKLKSVDGLEEVEVSLEHRNATVYYKEGNITPDQVQDAIREIGYKTGKPLLEDKAQ